MTRAIHRLHDADESDEGWRDPVNSTPAYQRALKQWMPVIEKMRVMGFGLMLDGKTFYQLGNEIEPRNGMTFDMNQAITITQHTEQSVAKYQEELKDFAQDVLGQFGYSGSSGGLSTLEWAASIIKKGGKL